MDFAQEVSENEQQILQARRRGFLKDLDEGILMEISAHGKYMLAACSDFRYNQLLTDRIRLVTSVDKPHPYTGHGGILLLKKDTPLMPADSTYRRDTVAMMKIAYNVLGIRVLVGTFHGPDCKAMLMNGVGVDSALQMISDISDELHEEMPELVIIPMLHRDLGGRECQLNHFCIDTYREDQENKFRTQQTLAQIAAPTGIAQSLLDLCQQFPGRATIVNHGLLHP